MAQILRLTGARVALAADRSERIDLVIQRGRFLPFDSSFDNHASADAEHDLSGHLILPGLINAHDHLEFALFPRLGHGPYANASEWAADIHRPEQSPVREHLQVPKPVRLAWGGIRNLIAGVTTVAHHNPWEPGIFDRLFPVRVVRKFGWAHSLAFSPDLHDRFHATPARWPFIVHAAEGTDRSAREEIRRLDEAGVLSRRTVLVHAVAAGAEEIAFVRKRRASIVWCPSSNSFTLGRTLDAAHMPPEIVVTLGTDSALTAEGDLMDEIRVARDEAGLDASRIYSLVTTDAARALRLRDGQGAIRERGVADFIAVRDTGQTPAEALLHLQPELIMIGGRAALLAPRFEAAFATPEFHEVAIKGRGRFLARAPIPQLFSNAARVLGPELKLGGKRVCA